MGNFDSGGGEDGRTGTSNLDLDGEEGGTEEILSDFNMIDENGGGDNGPARPDLRPKRAPRS